MKKSLTIVLISHKLWSILLVQIQQSKFSHLLVIMTRGLLMFKILMNQIQTMQLTIYSPLGLEKIFFLSKKVKFLANMVITQNLSHSIKRVRLLVLICKLVTT